MDFRESVVLSTLQDSTRGEWKATQVLYSYPGTHKVEFKRKTRSIGRDYILNQITHA